MTRLNQGQRLRDSRKDRFRAGLLAGMVESVEGKTIPLEDAVRLLGTKAA